MIHNEIVIKSGEHTLKKMTKTQVRNVIRDTGTFNGYICGNRVRHSHIADGWHLGMHVSWTSIEELNQTVESFETSLQVYHPESGTYAHYYQIVDASERNARLRREYATGQHRYK